MDKTLCLVEDRRRLLCLIEDKNIFVRRQGLALEISQRAILSLILRKNGAAQHIRISRSEIPASRREMQALSAVHPARQDARTSSTLLSFAAPTLPCPGMHLPGP